MARLSINKHFLISLLVLVLTACREQTTVSPTAEQSPLPVSTITANQTPDTIETPTVSENPLLLFARANDLWQVNVQGKNVTQLTTYQTLNWNMEEGDEWRLAAQNQPPTFSPDGKWLIFSPTGHDLTLINLPENKQINLPKPGAFMAVWSPDSRFVAYAPNHQELFIYDIENAQAISLFQTESPNIVNIVWSPDSQFVGFGCCFVANADGVSTGQIKRVEIVTGAAETGGEMSSSIGGGTPPLCWLPEGEIVQLSSENDLDGQCSYRPPGIEAISPDGTLRALLQPASANDSFWEEATLLTVENVQSSTPLWQRQLSENVKIVAWSADGQYLILDDFQSDSPIWRMKADNSQPPEILVDEGYLLDVASVTN